MIVSRDLDCSNTLYIQFSFKFITKGTPSLPLISIFDFFYLNFAVTVHPLGFFRSAGALPLGAAAVFCERRNQLAPVG